MARIRCQKPEMCHCVKLATVSIYAERTYLHLIPQCDDQGRHLDHAAIIAGILWALRPEHTAIDVESDLQQLAAAGLICRYTGCDGTAYLHVIDWHRQQKINRPSPSRIPPCPLHDTDPRCSECGPICRATRPTDPPHPDPAPPQGDPALSRHAPPAPPVSTHRQVGVERQPKDAEPADAVRVEEDDSFAQRPGRVQLRAERQGPPITDPGPWDPELWEADLVEPDPGDDPDDCDGPAPDDDADDPAPVPPQAIAGEGAPEGTLSSTDEEFREGSVSLHGGLSEGSVPGPRIVDQGPHAPSERDPRGRVRGGAHPRGGVRARSAPLLREHLDQLRAAPPDRIRAQLQRAVDQLVAEQIPEEFIRAGLQRMRTKQLGARLLPDLVAEAMNPIPAAPPGPPSGRHRAWSNPEDIDAYRQGW
ncbi:hypothetical protein [Mangrovactinospora gilvigrisea]|nr:hypothetical protein [Mangrovactinospora gilvigrisea]